MEQFKAGEVVWHTDLREWVLLEGERKSGVWNILRENGERDTWNGQWFARNPPPKPTFKRKVRKEVKVWVNVYESGAFGAMYLSRQDADDQKSSCNTRIDCIELTGYREVEEVIPPQGE